MDGKHKSDLLTVVHGQSREISKVKNTIEYLQNDGELEELQKESLSLLGATEIIPKKNDPVPVKSPKPVAWEDLVKNHEHDLKEDGIDVDNLTIEQLLPTALNDEIEKAWTIWPEREKWRWWEDFVVVGAAGLAGGLLDLYLSGKMSAWPEPGHKAHDDTLNEGNKEFYGKFGTDVKNPMRRHPIDARIPSDLMEKARPDLHRMAGPTHDVCRWRESLDLMMGTKNDFFVQGQSVAKKTGDTLRMIGLKGDEASNFNIFSDPEQAKFALLIHWKADFFSSRGLPLPGTSYLIDAGGTQAKVAKFVYENGLTLRELTMGLGKLSGVVVTELILRIHILIQRWRDNEKKLLDWSSKTRYREMFLVAHSIAAGVGGVATAVTGNPALINQGAIIMAAKKAIHLAYRVHKEKREALKKFSLLVENSNQELDEMMVRLIGNQVAEI